ncbi:hypothetical protein HDV63DRAFT_205228 [Trichoderma sp. SZMC 28014]
MDEASANDEAAWQFGNESLYAIYPVPGKGLGLIAIKDILKGTRILSELPLFKTTQDEPNRQNLKDHITKALKGGPGASLFPNAPFINHSCQANAHKSWNANIERLTVHAIRDIKQGEEITISYLEILEPYAARQARLKRVLIDCKCELCSAPRDRRQQSDDRIESVKMIEMGLVKKYFNKYLSDLPAHDYATGLNCALAIFTVLKAEGACDARFPGMYHTAFKISVMYGDKTRAKIFAERAYAARVVVEGDDSPAAMELAQFVEDPTRHPLYRPSADGKEVELPRGLSTFQFDDWLWLWKRCPDVGEEED